MSQKTNTQSPLENSVEKLEENPSLKPSNQPVERTARKAGGRRKIVPILNNDVQTDEFKRRFFSFVVRGENEDSCWKWKGHKCDLGYGYISLNGRPRLATRVSFVMHGGEFSEEKIFACHTCDNPECANPRHLWAGSNADNCNDAKLKNRVQSGKNHYASKNPEKLVHGVKHWMCKLTDEQVLEIRRIREETKMSYPKIAKLFNISDSHAHAVGVGYFRKRLVGS